MFGEVKEELSTSQLIRFFLDKERLLWTDCRVSRCGTAFMGELCTGVYDFLLGR